LNLFAPLLSLSLSLSRVIYRRALRIWRAFR